MAYRAPASSPSIMVVAFNTHIIGVDPASGRRVWYWTPLPAIAVGTWRIAIVDGSVLAASGTLVSCLAYETGRERWRTESPVAASTLLVDGDRFFLAGSGTLAAFARETGKLLWHEPFRGHGHGPVALGVPGNVVQADESG